MIHKQIKYILLFKNKRMVLLTNGYYRSVKDYLHPNIHTFVNHYRDENIIYFPNYHGCNHKNKNGNRKLIKYELGEQCINQTDRPYWKKNKRSIQTWCNK